MIRINLLGDNTAIDYSGKFLFAGFVASVVVLCGVFVMIYQSVGADVVSLEGQLAILNEELKGLEEKTKLVNDLEKKRETLNKKIDLIARLKKSKIGPVRVMDDLNVAIPEQVWLREISESDGSFRIKGRALDNQDIALFIRNLDASKFFSQVDLVESRQMYYSKETGKVSQTPDLKRLKTADFASESRVTIRKGTEGDSGGKRWGVRSQAESGTRKALVDDLNVKIKEFIVSAKVDYAGTAPTVSAEAKSDSSEKGKG